MAPDLAPAAARRLVLGAQLVGPERALALGCLDELVEPGAVLDRALEVAERMAALPARAYPVIKKQLRGEATQRMHALAAADPIAAGWLAGETAGAAGGLLKRG